MAMDGEWRVAKADERQGRTRVPYELLFFVGRDRGLHKSDEAVQKA